MSNYIGLLEAQAPASLLSIIKCGCVTGSADDTDHQAPFYERAVKSCSVDPLILLSTVLTSAAISSLA